MNILFVGGSNLVIKQGISTLIPECLRNSGISVDNVYNIAVGATPCLFGLENLTLFKKKQIDLVFIEYGINDLPLFSNDSFLWERAFSGLLSLVRKQYPSAKIVTILLGRLKERFWKNQSRMHQRMGDISSAHNALVVNVDEALKAKISSPEDLEQFYLDDSHFKSPNVTQYISEKVVSEFLLNDSLGFFSSSKKSVKASGAINLHSLPGLVHCFENTRFNKQTTIINKGDAVELQVIGTPSAISFASVAESCSVLIEYNGNKKIINMRRRKTGKLSFVLKQIPLYGFLGKINPNDTSIVKITAIDQGSHLWKDEYMQKTYGMIPADSQSKKVYISHLSTF